MRKVSEGAKGSNVLKIMKWPPQRPEVNRIELLWNEVDGRIRFANPNCELCCTKEWDHIPGDTLKK